MFGCSNKLLFRFTDGEADSALQADHGWWSPVIFLNSNIPVPTDRLMRQPIRFSYSADGKSHDYLPDPKPTFLWVGNDGEFIPSETATNLNTADQYMRLEHGELERIQDFWTYWEDNRPPPSINVPTNMDKPTAERWKREGKGEGRAEGKAERKDQRGERTGRRKGHYGRAGFGIGMGWGYGGGGGEGPGNGSAETLETIGGSNSEDDGFDWNDRRSERGGSGAARSGGRRDNTERDRYDHEQAGKEGIADHRGRRGKGHWGEERGITAEMPINTIARGGMITGEEKDTLLPEFLF
ncbi:hypothetical protein BU17DRAFT_69983 [Hysterangium stoloniferum]|nr:hypothetical protein BU17DRAFT_69983 [Hysterangium stoloniferum]